MKCKRITGVCILLVRFALFVVLILGAPPAFAQISFDSGATHKEDLKYALEEAREVESVYKETHLNLDNRNFRKGEAALKRSKVKSERKLNKFAGPGSVVLHGSRTKKYKARNRDNP